MGAMIRSSLSSLILIAFVGAMAPGVMGPRLMAGEGCSSGFQPLQKLCLSDGRCLSYRVYGEPAGRPVFYFHGIMGSSISPRLIESEIRAAGIRMIAIDRPGMGESTFQRGRSVLCWVQDFAEVLAFFGYERSRVGIIAVSGGASYGCACVVKMPERISHLAIVSGHTPSDAECVEPGIGNRAIELITRSPNVGKLGLAPKTRQVKRNPAKVAEWFAREWSPSDRDMVLGDCGNYTALLMGLQTAMNQGPRGIIRDIVLLGTPPAFDFGAAKACSVTIWSGCADPVVTPSMARWFHRKIAGSRLVLGPGEGHVTMLKNYAPSILAEF